MRFRPRFLSASRMHMLGDILRATAVATSECASLERSGIPRGRRPAILLAGLLLCACASNRPIEHVPAPPPLDANVAKALPDADFASAQFVARDGTHLPYRLLPPLDPQPGARYPLVLVLHGSGAIGDDNRSQLGALARGWAAPALRARYHAYVLVPQFPVRSADYDSASAPRIAHATSALSAALELVDAVVARHAVDRTRIYVTGFSMGGSAAWLAPLLRPDLFAAAMPISGIAPDRNDAARLRDVPLLVLHGDADRENPIDADREMVARLHASNAPHVRLREYAGLAHEIPGDVPLGTWWRDWLFAQRRPRAR
jgi:predicted peptidase